MQAALKVMESSRCGGQEAVKLAARLERVEVGVAADMASRR